MSMNHEKQSDRKLIGTLCILAFIAAWSPPDATSQSLLSGDSVDVTHDDTAGPADSGEESPDNSAIWQGMETRKQERRAFLDARHAAKLERIDKAKQETRPAPRQDEKPDQAQPQQVKQEASPEDARRETPPSKAAQAIPMLGDIDVSFKTRPLSTRGSQKGDAWTSTYTGVQADSFTVEARFQGRDSKGQPVDITPEWMPADHAMVEVTPTGANSVKITVRGTGESNITVAALGFSKDLWISATSYQGTAIQLRISQ